MKKIFAAFALALMAMAASATTISVEYDYNMVAGSPSEHAGYITLAQETKLGTFDFGIQAAGAVSDNAGAVRATGWEIGYSLPITTGKITLIPRIATGAMNTIDPNASGFSKSDRYVLGSVEAQMPLTASLTGYTSYTRMSSIIADQNFAYSRVQAGVDFSVTKALTVRTGLSHTQTDRTVVSNGAVVVASYSF